MNSCVHLCVCLCVRPINISTLPNSRCLYNTAVLLSSCLSLYFLDCFIEVHSDTLYEGEQERERCTPKPQHKTSLSVSLLHRRNSNLGTNLCVVLAKIDELPGWESARLHSGGNNKSPGLPSRRAPWRVACVRRSSPLPCLPHLSSNLSPLLTSLYPSSPTYPLLVCDCSDKWSCARVLGTGGHAPSVCVWACACRRARVPGGRKAHTVYSDGKIQSGDSTHLCIPPASS